MFVGLTIAAAILTAQTQAFEVASIKPSGSKSQRGSDGGPGSSDPARYTFGKAELKTLIMIAYHVEPFQVSSRFPLEEPTFDLVATMPPGTDKPQFRVMLQNLLAERFQLKLHKEIKVFPAYELVIAKGGLKLRDGVPLSSVPPGFPDLPPNRPGLAVANTMPHGFPLARLRSQQEPISSLCNMLRPLTDQPIVDRSGLTGKYDFILEFSPDMPRADPNGSSEPSDAPPLPVALQKQLGLQLVSKKLPFDLLVIDSVAKLPIEN